MIYCHESKKQGKHVVLVRDKLFIDGMIYCHLRNRVCSVIRDKIY